MTDETETGPSRGRRGERAGRHERHERLQGFGAFLRQQRRLAALSQRELARLANLSDPYVSQLERGLHEPSVRVLRALATALNVRADSLLAYAGWLEDGTEPDERPERSDVEAAVRADLDLTPDEQEAVLAVYRSFKAAHRA
jgi:transcriptional regulator with XRE-family HTH domain